MSLVKNLGGRVKAKKIFGGEGVSFLLLASHFKVREGSFFILVGEGSLFNPPTTHVAFGVNKSGSIWQSLFSPLFL